MTTMEATKAQRTERSTSWTWRTVLRAAALASIAVSAFAVVTIGGVEAVVFAALIAIGVWWLRRPGRGGVVYLGVVQLLVGLVVLILFGLLPELAYPASWKVFIAAGGRLVATLTALVAAVGALVRQGEGGPAPRAVAAVAGVALLGFSIVGIGARLGVSDDKRRPGDVVLILTADTRFEPRQLEVAAGKIAVYVDNRDVHHGTFTIDGVVSFDVPAGSAQRATFELSPGRYRYYSKLFPEEGSGTMVAS